MTTLCKRECIRFLRVYNQTILSPVVNALIFYLIFTVAFAGRGGGFEGISYNEIVATGLIAMSVLQASYFNTQSTISIARMLGFIKDYTIAPLTTLEIFTAMVISSVVRAMCVGVLTAVALFFLYQFPLHNVLIALYYLLVGAVFFAEIGIMIGFASQDFDKAHAYTAYIVTPLTMLSGTFYSAYSLPQPWQNTVLFNPVFYIIDGFRYGITGVGNFNVFGMFAVFALTIICGFVSISMLKRGIRN